MMNYKNISQLAIVFVLIFIVVDMGFSQERNNPFKDQFPVIEIEQNETEEEPIVYIEPEKTFDPYIYNVDGIIWGVYKPRAIINNEIYSIGDKLGEAEIAKIGKEGVTLVFDDEEYVITPKKAIDIKTEE